MPSKSKSQKRLMQMVKNDPQAAKRLGIPRKVAVKFLEADKRLGISMDNLPERLPPKKTRKPKEVAGWREYAVDISTAEPIASIIKRLGARTVDHAVLIPYAAWKPELRGRLIMVVTDRGAIMTIENGRVGELGLLQDPAAMRQRIVDYAVSRGFTKLAVVGNLAFQQWWNGLQADDTARVSPFDTANYDTTLEQVRTLIGNGDAAPIAYIRQGGALIPVRFEEKTRTAVPLTVQEYNDLKV